jgi:hypothetical protein
MNSLGDFKYKKQLSRTFFCLGLIAVSYGLLRREKAMKHTVVVIAKVTGFQHPKIDRTEVDIQYNYNGKIVNNDFSLRHPDSLKVNTKIRLLISSVYPTESQYIKYLGVENQ